METKINYSEIAKQYYTAYENQDKQTVADLLLDDFTFCSPNDDYIAKDVYFEKCWAMSDENPKFSFESILENGSDVFVFYKCETQSKRKFRNVELIRFKRNKIQAIEVYFGNALHV